MRLGNPHALVWLLCLLPLAILFLWSARRRKKRLDLLADTHLQADLTGSFSPQRARQKTVLWLAGFSLCLLSLARPQWGFDWQEVHRKGIDILILLDTSNSMLAEDVKPNRMERSKLAIEDLVRQLRGDRIGLIAFAGSAFLQCPMTLDYDAFLSTTKALEVGYIPRGGTNLQAAVEEGLQAFGEDSPNHKAIVLITDGENLEGDVEAVTRKAASRKIKIFSVGIGTEAGELIPVRDQDGRISFLRDRDGNPVKTRLNPEPLRQLCASTGGMFVQAGSTDFGLQTIYETGIAPMSPQELASRMQKRWKERFQIPLALGLLLLGLGILLPETRRKLHAQKRPLLSIPLLLLILAPIAHAQTTTPTTPPAAPPTSAVSPPQPPSTPITPATPETPDPAQPDEPPLSPRDVAQLLKTGITAYHKEQYDDAATAFRKVLRAQPDSGIANYNNGLVLYQLELYDKAIEHWRSVVGDLPLMAKTHFNIGNAIVRQAENQENTPSLDDAIQQYHEALKEFQKAVELNRSDPDARKNFEIIYQRILELQNQKEKMARVTEETRAETMRLIGERQYAQAAQYLQQAAAENQFLQQTLSDLIPRVQALAQIFPEQTP